MLCTDWTIVKRDRKAIRVKPLFCNSWSCEVCAPRRAAKVSNQLRSGRPTKFLTLTVNPAVGTDPVDRAKRLAEAFRKWIRLLRKDFPDNRVEYYCIFERTKEGEPHLHILGDWPWIDQRDISAFFDLHLEAPVVWIEGIKTVRGASKYVSKYLTKDCTKFGNLKRYFSSRGYMEPYEREPEPEPWCWIKWERIERPFHEWVVDSWAKGWKFIDNGEMWLHEARPP